MKSVNTILSFYKCYEVSLFRTLFMNRAYCKMLNDRHDSFTHHVMCMRISLYLYAMQ